MSALRQKIRLFEQSEFADFSNVLIVHITRKIASLVISKIDYDFCLRPLDLAQAKSYLNSSGRPGA